jgi:hypothetical protein
LKFAYVYRADPDNPGDLYSSPMHYLGDTCNGVVIDIFAQDIPKMSVDALIIGGGALFTNKKFFRNLAHKLENITAKHTVVWGVGFDAANIDVEVKNQFSMFSTREHKLDPDIPWVPCASALHRVFSEIKHITPTQDFLVVDHFKRSIPFDRLHTRIINRPNSMRAIVEQIADHRFIITSSYHVAYWSILMGRRCAVIGDGLPTKFNRMKHFPVKSKIWHDSLYDQAKLWPDAHHESAKANYRYYRQLEDLLGIENPLQLSWMQYTQLKRETS